MSGSQALDLRLPTWANKDCIKCYHWVGIFELCRRLTVAECHWLGCTPQFLEQGPWSLSLNTRRRGKSKVFSSWPGPRVE